MALFATLLVFIVIGWATAAWTRLSLPASRAGRIAGMFLLGAGSNGLALYVLGTIGVPLVRATFAVPLVASVVLVVVRHRLTTAPPIRHPRAATLILVLPLLAAIAAGTVLPFTDYDGRVTWLPKAAAIAHESSITGPFFQGQRGLNLHNHYPLLMPLDAATVLRLTGRSEEETARWLYALIPLALLLLARDELARTAGSVSSWVVAAVAWLPALYLHDGGMLSAYSDLAVAAFLGGAVLALVNDDPRAAGVWLTFLVLTKNEGLLLAAIVVAVALATRVVQTRSDLARMVVPPTAATLVLIAWRAQVPDAYDERNAALLADLPAHLHRAGEAATALLGHALRPAEWSFYWPIVAIGACVAVFRRSPKALVPIFVLVLALGGYVAAFMVTGWRIEELAGVAAHRLLLHLLVPGACVLASAASAARRAPAPASSRTSPAYTP